MVLYLLQIISFNSNIVRNKTTALEYHIEMRSYCVAFSFV